MAKSLARRPMQASSSPVTVRELAVSNVIMVIDSLIVNQKSGSSYFIDYHSIQLKLTSRFQNKIVQLNRDLDEQNTKLDRVTKQVYWLS